jgi:hypothetical protein
MPGVPVKPAVISSTTDGPKSEKARDSSSTETSLAVWPTLRRAARLPVLVVVWKTVLEVEDVEDVLGRLFRHSDDLETSR